MGQLGVVYFVSRGQQDTFIQALIISNWDRIAITPIRTLLGE